MSLYFTPVPNSWKPATNGWRFDPAGDIANKGYTYLATFHPDCPQVIFGMIATQDAWQDINGVWHHDKLVTGVRALKPPPKPDDEFWVIDQAESVRLQQLEQFWWADYDIYRAANNDRGQHPEQLHRLAVAHAHWQTRTAGR